MRGVKPVLLWVSCDHFNFACELRQAVAGQAVTILIEFVNIPSSQAKTEIEAGLRLFLFQKIRTVVLVKGAGANGLIARNPGESWGSRGDQKWKRGICRRHNVDGRCIGGITPAGGERGQAGAGQGRKIVLKIRGWGERECGRSLRGRGWNREKDDKNGGKTRTSNAEDE